MAEIKAYSQAAHTGKYDRASSLVGKYDNVRRFWEDQITSISMRPALNELVERKKRNLERIRILDLGCGSGDGFDLIMGVTTKDPGIYEYITVALTDDMLKEYVGLDINEDLLRQAAGLRYHDPVLLADSLSIRYLERGVGGDVQLMAEGDTFQVPPRGSACGSDDQSHQRQDHRAEQDVRNHVRAVQRG